jgi:chromosome segregation ATPase
MNLITETPDEISIHFSEPVRLEGFNFSAPLEPKSDDTVMTFKEACEMGNTFVVKGWSKPDGSIAPEPNPVESDSWTGLAGDETTIRSFFTTAADRVIGATRLAKRVDELERLMHEMANDHRTAMKELTEHIGEMSRLISDQQAENAELMTQRNLAEATVDEQAKRISELETAGREGNEMRRDLMSRLHNTVEINENLNYQLVCSRDHEQVDAESLAYLTAQNDRLLATQRSDGETIDALNEQVSRLEGERDEWQRRAVSLEEKRKSYEADFEGHTIQIDNLAYENMALHHQVENLTRCNNEQVTIIEGLNEKISLLECEKSIAESEITRHRDAANARMDRMTADYNSLQHQVDEAQTLARAATTHKDNAIRELTELKSRLSAVFSLLD